MTKETSFIHEKRRNGKDRRNQNGAKFQKSVEELKLDLDVVTSLLKDAEKKAADYWDQLLRLKAEFENYRKRMEKERTDIRMQGKQEVIARVIGLLDVIEEARRYVHKSDNQSVAYGLDLLFSEFRQFLRDEGLEEIVPEKGRAFDSALHEVVEAVDQEGDEGQIVSVLRKGYLHHGNLLRPARVTVSKKPVREETSEPEASMKT